VIPEIKITHLEHLSLIDGDFHELNTKVKFHQIEYLELNVNPSIFLEYISSISHCKKVVVPANIPKLLVYAKITECEDIQFTLPNSEPCIDYAKEANQLVKKWNT
jgi:hypothetical protein